MTEITYISKVKEILKKWRETYEEEYGYLVGDDILKEERKIIDDLLKGNDEKIEVLGYCWVLGLCNWWNPAVDLMLDSLGKINFCMKCWEMGGYDGMS